MKNEMTGGYQVCRAKLSNEKHKLQKTTVKNSQQSWAQTKEGGGGSGTAWRRRPFTPTRTDTHTTQTCALSWEPERKQRTFFMTHIRICQLPDDVVVRVVEVTRRDHVCQLQELRRRGGGRSHVEWRVNKGHMIYLSKLMNVNSAASPTKNNVRRTSLRERSA